MALTWKVYILECADGTLYTGVTNDLTRRLEAHAKGRGAKYTRGRGPFAIRYTETHSSKGHALQREGHIKKLDTVSKRALRAP
jgi:putative endonuclease